MPNEVAVEVGMHDYQRYRATASFINNDKESFY